jgi:hypothetical protein
MTNITGNRHRKSMYDPDLARRVNEMYANEPDEDLESKVKKAKNVKYEVSEYCKFPFDVHDTINKVNGEYIVQQLDLSHIHESNFYNFVTKKKEAHFDFSVWNMINDIDGSYLVCGGPNDERTFYDFFTKTVAIKLPVNVYPHVSKVDGRYFVLEQKGRAFYNLQTTKKEAEFPVDVFTQISKIDGKFLVVGLDYKSVYSFYSKEKEMEFPFEIDPWIFDINGRHVMQKTRSPNCHKALYDFHTRNKVASFPDKGICTTINNVNGKFLIMGMDNRTFYEIKPVMIK